MLHYLLSGLAFIGCLVSAQPCMAQTPSEIEPHHEQMVVTAQFQPESSKDSLVEVTVLDRRQMEERGARTLGELLTGELLMETRQHTVFGTSLNIAGISQENIKVLINGMPVIGRLDGIIDLEQLSLMGFERVEIIKGPASVYFGTDSHGGVVNLIPLKAGLASQQAALHGSYRDIGDGQQKASGAFSKGNSVFSLHMGRRHFQGENTNPDSRRKEWAERSQNNGSFQWRHYYRNMTISYLGSLGDETLTDLGEFNDGFAWDRDYRTKRQSHQFNLEGQYLKRFHFNFLAGHSNYDRSRTSYQSFAQVSPPNGESQSDPAFDNRFRLSKVKGMITLTNVLPFMDAQLGLDWNNERGSGGRILGGAQTMEDQAIFGGARIRLPGRVTFQPMVRFTDHNHYNAPTTPSLHLKHQAGSLTWRAFYSKGFRGPSLKQLYLDFALAAGPFQYHITGNQNLGAEQGHHYGVSIQYPLLKHFNFNARLFYNDIQDLIALSTQTRDPQIPNLIRRTYINIHQHRSRGGEVALAGRFGDTSWDFSFARTETFNAFSQISDLPDFNGRWDGRIALRHLLGKQRFSLLYKHLGEQPGFVEVLPSRGQPSVIEEVTIPAYQQVDLFWHFKPRRPGLSLGVGIKNLTDVIHRDTVIISNGAAHESNLLGWGRTIQVDFGWRWAKGQ